MVKKIGLRGLATFANIGILIIIFLLFMDEVFIRFSRCIDSVTGSLSNDLDFLESDSGVS